MKLLRLLTVFLLFIIFSQAAIAQEAIAIVIMAKGTVILQQRKNKKYRIRPGARIYSDSKIITKKKSFAAIRFIDDGSTVRIRPNSSLRVEGKKKQNSLFKNLFLDVGSIFSKIVHQKGVFRVTTPTSVASVKGTAFWTVQEFKGATRYFGEEGTVEIKNKSGIALLGPGETGYVSSPGSKPIVRRTKPGEKPELDESKSTIDEFEFEFQNNNGQKKDLKFKVKTKK